MQRKLPTINSAHGTETRNIINELIKLFNGMGYTYDEALQKAHDVLNEAQKTNNMNANVQQQIDNVLKGVADPTSEIAQARGPFELLNQRLDDYDDHFIGLETNVAYHGIFPDGQDYTEKIRAVITQYKNLVFPGGDYIISDELLFTHGQSIRCVGKVTFDGSNFVGDHGNNVLKVTNKGSNYRNLPTLENNIEIGDNELNFSGNHGLEVGDIICLYDSTDFSWSSTRAYYRKSEFCKVASVPSSSKVSLDSEIFDSYQVINNTNFGAYRMNMGTFDIYGHLEVIQGKPGYYHGALIERIVDFSADNINAYALNGSYIALALSQCYNVDFRGKAIQEKLTGLGGDYGLGILNCQHVRGHGYFSSARHGLVHGGYSGIGCIINRDTQIYGTVKTTGEGLVGALDSHGNTELFSFYGVVYGGAFLGGAKSNINGTVYADRQGICVYFREMKSFDHDLSGMKFISKRNISSTGVVNFGGSSTVEADKMEGGVLNLSGIEIQAPYAKRGVTIRTRNEEIDNEAKLYVDLSNSKLFVSKTAGSTSVYINKFSNSTKGFEVVDLTNATLEDDTPSLSTSDIKKLLLPKQRGEKTYTTNEEVNNIIVTISFPQSYPSAYTPIILVNLDRGGVGAAVAIEVVSVNTRSFSVRIRTVDGTKFTQSLSGKFTWIAE